MQKSIAQLSTDTIRTLSMDAVQKANSGHPGMPMGMADVAYVLFQKFLRHNPKNPKWINRDRFVLSAGHGSMLLYSMLHLTGYDVTLDDIKQFRQWGSRTPGHPEFGHTPGVETTTGPLGQGFANGVGFALAEAHLGSVLNTPDFRVIDHYTYAIVSDGDLMEGISHEAASFAGHLKLGKLIYLYDDNNISIEGNTDCTFTEDVKLRFESYGWHVQTIDGHNRAEIETALKEAQQVSDKPSIIRCKTKIGFGSPNKEGSEQSHGAPLGKEEIRLTKEAYGWDPDKSFYIPMEVSEHMGLAIQYGKEREAEWNAMMMELKLSDEAAHSKAIQMLSGTYPEGWADNLPVYPADEKGVATRKASGKALNFFASRIPMMLGGSADLAGSNITEINGEAFIDADLYDARNIHFGVREHAMVSIANGMIMHGVLKPYVATFLVFSDYCKPAIRVAALSKIDPILVFTHDSIGLGEDGPTHQPIEHLTALRAIPNVVVLRPADANETVYSWKKALEIRNAPVALVFTRQNLPVYERSEVNAAVLTEKGAYILSEAKNGKPELLLIGSGSEVQYAFNAQAILEEKGISTRVVSMPSMELFAMQSAEYQESVLPKSVRKRVAIEAGSTMSWYRIVGSEGKVIGLDHYGASAPFEILYKEFGFTTENVVETTLSLF
ncbi:MAG: transketolase [Bacteroidetes bacterium]|nr:transketolase [Bacteroidota bacterium]